MDQSPIEKMYMQIVMRLKDVVFSSQSTEAELKAAYEALEQHIERATKLKLPYYEIEARNVIGNYYMSHAKDPASALRHSEKALERAAVLGDVGLQAKMLNNIGNVYMDAVYLQKARTYHQQCAELALTVTPPTIDVLFAYANLASASIGAGDWTRAQEELEKFEDYVTKVEVPPALKYDYGVIIQFRHTLNMYIYLALANHDDAQSALNMAVQLAEQLQDSVAMDELPYLIALHELIALGRVEDFEAWVQTDEFDNKTIAEQCKMVMLLVAAEQPRYASTLKDRLLDGLAWEEERERVQAVLKGTTAN